MTDMHGRLDSKTVVVTGAGRGQGFTEAELFARAGATVLACDRHFPSVPDGTHPVDLDVTDAAGWKVLGERIDAEHGGVVHGLVNNAGVTWRDRLLEVAVADFERVYSVNVTGMLLGIQAMAPRMTDGGSIVNIGSAAAFTGHYTVAYTTSKWAVRGLTAVSALELGSRGIRVNAVHPGFVETEMTASAPPAFRDATWQIMPMRRLGQVDDIANAVLFLLSDESGFVNGADLVVDGGQTSAGGSKVLSDALRPVAR